MHTIQLILVIWLILVKVTKINKKAHHIVLRTYMCTCVVLSIQITKFAFC